MRRMTRDMTRREALRLMGLAAAGTAVSMSREGRVQAEVVGRPIPSSGEVLPVIGLGTYRTFDVGAGADERKPVAEVLARFAALGGRVVDTSPMYGAAEGVLGDLAAEAKLRDGLFLATKVWTSGRQAGIEQMERSLDLLRTKRVDLMQVHNLLDAGVHLATLREWKKAGRVRHVGVTHYVASAYPEVERVLARETLDTVQINFSPLEREAESRLLPLARERGVAVIVNRPFGGGELFSRSRGKALPDVARDLGCTSWAQLVLKWILGHPAVTCAIPATSRVSHLEDNLGAARGPFPDASARKKILDAVRAL
jgi:diketogulonate reductase-like aldo/keto reductase